jgi:hypothetical protein
MQMKRAVSGSTAAGAGSMLPKHYVNDQCPRKILILKRWLEGGGEGVQNPPLSCNPAYSLRSFHNAVLPSTPQ